MYLSPMVTHDGNQGEEKCSGGRDIFDFAQILQLVFKIKTQFKFRSTYTDIQTMDRLQGPFTLATPKHPHKLLAPHPVSLFLPFFPPALLYNALQLPGTTKMVLAQILLRMRWGTCWMRWSTRFARHFGYTMRRTHWLIICSRFFLTMAFVARTVGFWFLIVGFSIFC
jgi:hypothetical protein